MAEQPHVSSSSHAPAASDTTLHSQDARPDREAKGWDVPVVGIGASAGGLQALRQFFTAMPIQPNHVYLTPPNKYLSSDREGHFLLTNTTLANMLGYRQPELHQMTFQETTQPDDLQATQACFEQLYSGQLDACKLEQRCRRQDTTLFWTELSIRAVRRPDKTVEAQTLMITDMTQRKQTEEALQTALNQHTGGRLPSSSGSSRPFAKEGK